MFLAPKINWIRFLGLSLIALVLSLAPLTVQASQASQSPVAANWASASFPVENFQAYTSGFGYRFSPSTGQKEFHQGLDIAAPLGSYVRSWWSGKISELSDNTACGTMIQIQSGPWQHIYCHLNGQIVKNAQGTYLLDQEGRIQLFLGQQVRSGQRIARVGMTGRTTGPHLHWGLIYRGQYVDPADVLRAMYARS